MSHALFCLHFSFTLLNDEPPLSQLSTISESEEEDDIMDDLTSKIENFKMQPVTPVRRGRRQSVFDDISKGVARGTTLTNFL